MITKDTWVRGLKNGLNTTWILGKVIVPVYLLVVFLKHSLVLDWLAEKLQPATALVGLPGEAALALVMGKAINLYAAIGVIVSLDFTAKEITIMAVMLSLAHSLPVEGAVGAKAGVSPVFLTGLRIGLAVIAGVILNLVI